LRTAPASRAQRALQIVLSDPAAWDALSHSDHALLCELPPPHGALFTWLASQVMEHGPQPWSALRHALRGHEYETVAVTEMEQLPQHITAEAVELQDILHGEQREHLKRRMDAALAAHDLALYQELTRQLAENR
jgi:DNA primase